MEKISTFKYPFLNLLKLILFIPLLYNCSLSAKELNIETIDIFPFGHMGPDDKVSGLIYEISNKIAQEAGFTYKNTLTPYARTIIDLKNGYCDFVIRYSNPELEKIAIPVANIIGFDSIIIANKGNQFKSQKDLHGKTIGKIRGGLFDNKIYKDKEIHKYEANDYDQLFKMLLANRFDAIIGSTIGIYSNAKKMNIPINQLSSPLILQKKYFILHFSKKNADPKIIKTLKDAINKLQSNGEFLKIEKSYELSM
ncbi:MAG: transporter substrate-binding domain-containing protein [Bacteriovorax sp.]|nr:transporter substrate-binding domain-containing protein [Bacteriovorax sp.]